MYIEYIEADNKYKSVNEVLQSEFKISARLRNKLINKNMIFLNDVCCDSRMNIKSGDRVKVCFDYEEDNFNIIATEMSLDILYEDDWFLVINKPANIAIHSSMLHYSDSLSNGVKFYFDKINLKKKIRPVNRLDFDTSGIVIFAKCEYIQECLIKQMQLNIFKKSYIAVVNGIFEKKIGKIDLPISRKPNSIIERCIDFNGKKSITDYEVIKEFESYSLVKCFLETGRTHQIRVHMSAIGHPIIGDTLYGTESNLISRQALHSYSVSFIHPIFKTNCDIVCDIPDDIKKVSKSVSRVLSFKIVIYLGHILLYVSSHSN